MTDKQSSTTTAGTSLSSMLFVAFVVLKLMHSIDWSWWWVTAPLWLPFTVGLVLFATCASIIAWRDDD